MWWVHCRPRLCTNREFYSLFLKTYIFQAAHCFGSSPVDTKHYTVLAGSTSKKNQGGQVREVLSIDIHSCWDGGSLSKQHDIAYILLKSNFTYKTGKNSVLPVCLPKSPKDEEIARFGYCKVAGWGRANFARWEYFPTDVREGYVKFYEKDQCESVVGSSISNSQYCFGDIENGVDTCQGDSGGPVICDYGSRSIALGKEHLERL